MRGDGRTSVRPSVGAALIDRPAGGIIDPIEADAPAADGAAGLLVLAVAALDGVATGEPEGLEGDIGLLPFDGDPFTGVEGEDGPDAG